MRTQVTEEVKAQIAALKKSGRTGKEICDELKISKATAHRYAKWKPKQKRSTSHVFTEVTLAEPVLPDIGTVTLVVCGWKDLANALREIRNANN